MAPWSWWRYEYDSGMCRLILYPLYEDCCIESVQTRKTNRFTRKGLPRGLVPLVTFFPREKITIPPQPTNFSRRWLPQQNCATWRCTTRIARVSSTCSTRGNFGRVAFSVCGHRAADHKGWFAYFYRSLCIAWNIIVIGFGPVEIAYLNSGYRKWTRSFTTCFVDPERSKFDPEQLFLLFTNNQDGSFHQ